MDRPVASPGSHRRVGPNRAVENLLAALRDADRSLGRMHYCDRSFDALIWPRPTNSIIDWLELAALLTPRGERTPGWTNAWFSSAPLASAPAAKRMLLLSYANRIAVRIVEVGGKGRRTTVHRDAYFEGTYAADALRRLALTAQRLDGGAGWIDGLPNKATAAIALWRATLLCNGLVRATDDDFTTRVSSPTRASALLAATHAVGLSAELQRRPDGLRLRLEAADADKLLDRLLDGSGLETFA
jgi:hypothetical protein